MKDTFIPNFTYDEESDLLCAVGHAVAYMKHLSDESIDNKDYWMQRAESFDKISTKLHQELHNYYFSK